MSRIAPLEPPYAPEIQAQFDRIMRGAPPLMLFRVMAGNARAWEKFRAGSLLDRGPLSLREREIVIDRTCALNGCEYEWGVHVATLRSRASDRRAGPRHRAGGADAPCWSESEQALIAAVDALHHRATLSDAEFAGAVGALRRREDFRDHPALRLLSHRVVSRERARSAAGGEGGAVSDWSEAFFHAGLLPKPEAISIAPSKAVTVPTAMPVASMAAISPV
jgi:alkylhydroperoxidase family enzyme